MVNSKRKSVVMLIVMMMVVLAAIMSMIAVPYAPTEGRRVKERMLRFKLREFRRALDKYTKLVNEGKITPTSEYSQLVGLTTATDPVTGKPLPLDAQTLEVVLKKLKDAGLLRKEYEAEQFDSTKGEWRIIENRVSVPDFEKQDEFTVVTNVNDVDEIPSYSELGKWFIYATSEAAEIRFLTVDSKTPPYTPPYIDYYYQTDVYGLSDTYGYVSKYGRKVVNFHLNF